VTPGARRRAREAVRLPPPGPLRGYVVGAGVHTGREPSGSVRPPTLRYGPCPPRLALPGAPPHAGWQSRARPTLPEVVCRAPARHRRDGSPARCRPRPGARGPRVGAVPRAAPCPPQVGGTGSGRSCPAGPGRGADRGPPGAGAGGGARPPGSGARDRKWWPGHCPGFRRPGAVPVSRRGSPGTPFAGAWLPPGAPRAVGAVVFDTDGVLTDSARLHAAAWKDAFDPFLAGAGGHGPGARSPFDTGDDYLRHVDGKTRLDGARDFLSSRGLHPSGEEVRELAAAKERAFLRRLERDGADVFPDAVRLLRHLHRRGLPLAAASASRHAGDLLDRAGLRPLLGTVVDGNDSARLRLPGKPDPALFLEAARQLGCAPASTAVVEDAVAGAEAGRRGGFGLIVGVERAGLPERRARLTGAGADLVVTGLGELLTEEERP
jgi:HAD superfamily hydrolase (TIGR01509 family)